MSVMVFQITSVSVVYLSVCSGADQRKHGSSASLDFVRGIHRWPVNSPQKGQVTRKMFPFDDVIMRCQMTIMMLIANTLEEWFPVIVSRSAAYTILTKHKPVFRSYLPPACTDISRPWCRYGYHINRSCTDFCVDGGNTGSVFTIILTHWGRDKMAAIFQTTFWNAFSWMKMCDFLLRFHLTLFPMVKLTIFQHWFR